MNWERVVAKNLEPVWAEYKNLDSWGRACEAEQVNAALLAAQKELSRLRRAAVRALRAEGYTLAEIGRELGVTPTRVMQIEAGYNRAERKERKATR